MQALRPYQSTAITQLRDRFRAGHRRVILVSPTGSGKTAMASEAARLATAKQRRIMFLVHRSELLDQAAGALESATGEKVGQIRPGVPENSGALVQVASVWTLIKREPWKEWPAELVIVDESHHTVPEPGGNTWGQLLTWWPRAAVVGLTATPWRQDGYPLGEFFTAHVLAATPSELRDAGYLSPVECWRYESISTTGLRVVAGDIGGSELLERAVKLNGAVVREWIAHAGGVRTVAYCVRVEHARALAAEFWAAGVAAEALSGETPEDDRKRINLDLRAGKISVVCNVAIFTEGVDIPELGCCLMCRPTMSTSLCLQMYGRILRPLPGKPIARIHDHAGCLEAHGHPYAPRSWAPETVARVSRQAVDRATMPREGVKAAPFLVTESALAERRLVDERARNTKAEAIAGFRRAFPKWPEPKRREWYASVLRKFGPGRAAHIYRQAAGDWPPWAWNYPSAVLPVLKELNARPE